MKIEIKIAVEGSALHDDFPGELTRLLSTVPAKIARQLERSGRCICEALESDDELLDINGNTVGLLSIVPDEDRLTQLRGLLMKIHDRGILTPTADKAPQDQVFYTIVMHDGLDICIALYDEFGDKVIKEEIDG